MSKNETKVMSVVRPAVSSGADTNMKGFQSTEARDRAMANAAPPSTDENAEPVLGAEGLVDKPDDPMMRMVRVRSRQHHHFRYGPHTYDIPANRDVAVPACVRLHMEEKGLL